MTTGFPNSPTRISSEMIEQCDSIDRELDRGTKHENDYAYAYGRMRALVTYYSNLVANLDPATALISGQPFHATTERTFECT